MISNLSLRGSAFPYICKSPLAAHGLGVRYYANALPCKLSVPRRHISQGQLPEFSAKESRVKPASGAAQALAASLLAGLVALASPSHAASYPEKPVSLIVGASAGGPSDIIARVTAEGLSKQLGQPVLVVNRPGASSAIAYNSFVRSPPDGYTLFMMTALTASLPIMQKEFSGGEPVESVEPVSLLAMNAIAIVARGNAPFSTLPEMITYAKANPDKLTYATVG